MASHFGPYIDLGCLSASLRLKFYEFLGAGQKDPSGLEAREGGRLHGLGSQAEDCPLLISAAGNWLTPCRQLSLSL